MTGVPVGAQGPKGDQGDRGGRGANGAQGPKGDRGTGGANWAQGPKGDKDTDSANGPQGPRGDRGANWLQGPKGDKDDRGDPGPGPGQDPVFDSVTTDEIKSPQTDINVDCLMLKAKMFGLNQTDVHTDGHEGFGYNVMHDKSNQMTKYSRNIAFYSRTGFSGYIEDDQKRNGINNFTGQHHTYIHNLPYS